MGWFSILPSYLNAIETWIIRFFLLMCIMTIGPWLLFLLYDMVLYLARALIHEIPYLGGRARGRRRPHAPSLAERPNGRKRTFSISGAVRLDFGKDEKENHRKRRADSVDSEGEEEISVEESRAIRSTDLWDAGTDSRFISGSAPKKRR